jgi:hypothetical protein
MLEWHKIGRVWEVPKEKFLDLHKSVSSVTLGELTRLQLSRIVGWMMEKSMTIKYHCRVEKRK